MFIQAQQNSKPLPAREVSCSGRAELPSLSSSEDKHLQPPWGRAPHQRVKEQSTPPFPLQRRGVASAAFSAHRVIYSSFALKFPLWASKPPYASTKPLLKIVRDRLHGFPSESSRQYLIYSLSFRLNDLAAECVLNTFQAFYTKMNRWKNRIFANSIDYSFVSR